MPLFGLFGPPDVKKLKAQGDIPGLIKALSYQKDAEVRQAAAQALGEIKTGQAIGPLLVALNDQDVAVQIAAVGALRQSGDARAVEPLAAALERANLSSLRNALVDALQALGWQPQNEAQRQRLAAVEKERQEQQAQRIKQLLKKVSVDEETYVEQSLRASVDAQRIWLKNEAKARELELAARDRNSEIWREHVKQARRWLRREQKAAVEEIIAMLESSAANFAPDDLRVIADLEDLTLIETKMELDARDDSWISTDEVVVKVDCPRARQLAQAELSRRRV